MGEARASGRSARDSRGRGAQTPVQSARHGPLAGSGRLARTPGPRAAPLWVGGRFQFRLPDPGCALGPEGQPEEGRRGHRPGRTFRPAAPRLRLRFPKPRTRRTDGSCSPLFPSPPPFNKGSPPRTVTQSDGLCRSRCGWAPRCGTLAQTSSCPHNQKHTQTLDGTHRSQSHPPGSPPPLF